MDFAYDHIQEEILASNKAEDSSESNNENSNGNLNTELQETFRAFSASPWGTRIGGLWDNVRKQGESYYEGAQKEYSAASEEAVKGFSDLRNSIVDRTKGLSLSTVGLTGGSEAPTDGAATPTAATEGTSKDQAQEADATGEGFISRFKAEAARRFKEIEKAEEAADEAILRFGLNISQKLREAVSIVPPETDDSGKLLFESKDADGKRVIHATRFEAQLHVIHSNLDSFTKDPVSDKFPEFKEDFNVESKTDEIAADLEKYPELRATMEKLVPEKVEYAEFWTRYYFLRLVVETEEQKRKELLKGANAGEEEEVGWDDDSEDESESPSTPQVRPGAQSLAAKDTLKPEPRRSNDQQSQADSESSYDVVSGTASRAPGSPKEKSPTADTKADDSDEDWE
ncbi:BSD domain protein [Penicillium brasilianum]|uniref:BSD domain protein n=1 Tax=Penicillium brasilianum TaxID=104259 RepID=A0A1S9RI74_PENBI|nr:BSD domain protein [Penicillium brasilianum]